MNLSAQHLAEDNFLVPNATFFVELAVFFIILFLLRKYVVPPVQKAMKARQDIIAQQIADAEEAKTKLANAEAEYQKALAEARGQASEIRENARAEGQQIVEELRTQAQAEQARIVARGDEQLATQRAGIVRELRGEIGGLAVELAEKIIDQRLKDDANVRATVDAFIADLESKENAGGAAK